MRDGRVWARGTRAFLSCAATLLLMLVFDVGACAEDNYAIDIVPQLGHSGTIVSVAFSPDGRQLLSSSYDPAPKLWDVATGRLLRTFTGHSNPVTALSFSPDGMRVLSGSFDSTVKLWDAATGKLLRSFEGHTGIVNSVAFSPDGNTVLSGSHDKSAKLWDAKSGKLVHTLGGHAELVSAVAFSPDGLTALSAGDGIRQWDVATGKLRRSWGRENAGNFAFSPNADRALCGIGGDALELWDVASGKRLRTWKGFFSSVAVSREGTSMLAGQNGLRFFDLTTGAPVRNFEGAGQVASVALSPDGAAAVSGGGDGIQLWDVATGKLLRSFAEQSREKYSSAVTFVAFSPEGDKALSASISSLNQWNVATGKRLRILDGGDVVRRMALSPDGTWAVSRGDSLKLWDMATGNLVRTFEEGTAQTAAFAFTPDGTRLVTVRGVGDKDNDARLWDLATGALLRTFKVGTSDASLAFSPDGTHLLSWTQGSKTLKLWDVATGKLRRNFETSGRVSAAEFSPNGEFILSGNFNNIEVWSVASGTHIRTFAGLSAWVRSIVVSPDGKWVLSGSDDSVRLWEFASGKLLQDFHTTAHVMAFSPDSRTALYVSALADGGSRTPRLWDVAAGRLVRMFEGHAGSVTSAAFTQDGKLLLSGGSDATMRLWKVDSGDLIATFVAVQSGGWFVLTREGFFDANSPAAAPLLGISRGLDTYGVDQIWQSLYAPDLVRAKLAGDADGEVARSAAVVSLDKVLDSGKAPKLAIAAPPSGTSTADEMVDVAATITPEAGGGIGRIEWRVNGITVGASSPPPNSAGTLNMARKLPLDPGANTIEVVAYNGRNLVASVPAKATVTWTGKPTERPQLHVLAIGINKYVDKGGGAAGGADFGYFPPLRLAVPDARALAEEIRRAGAGLYGDVHAHTVLDEEATAANLDHVIDVMAAGIKPRDTFVLYAATHGYSYQGRFYLIPQDYQGGADPQMLAERAIDQLKLQDWIANRIPAKKVIILLDSCESGALTSGYSRSRFDGYASDAAIGRLHEATGRPILTAAAQGQSALELTQLGHGVFTSALIDAFYRGDSNGDGIISFSEVISHVQDLVPRLIKDPKERAQVQHRGGSDGEQSARFGGRGEDFAFVRRLQ